MGLGFYWFQKWNSCIVNFFLFHRFIIFGVILLIILSQCITSPMPGLLYTNTGQHVAGTSPSITKVNSNLILKSGESCSTSSWFLVNLIFYGAGGDIQEAMERGGIQKVAVIDRRSRALVFGLFYQDCVVVWGE